jgi:hypothetical protein
MGASARSQHSMCARINSVFAYGATRVSILGVLREISKARPNENEFMKWVRVLATLRTREEICKRSDGWFQEVASNHEARRTMRLIEAHLLT